MAAVVCSSLSVADRTSPSCLVRSLRNFRWWSGSVSGVFISGFVHVMGTSMALGTITSIIFHVFFKYKKNDAISEVKINEEDISRANNKLAKPICTMTALDWFKEPQTYQVRN